MVDNINDQIEVSKTFSTVITVPFWIEVPNGKSELFPLIINKGEVVIQPKNLSNNQSKIFRNLPKDYQTYDAEMLKKSNILSDIKSDILFRVSLLNRPELTPLEEKVFNSFINNTVKSYPRNFRSNFIKIQLPEVIIVSSKFDTKKSVTIIPFLIRRNGFEKSPSTNRYKDINVNHYVIFIELVLLGDNSLIEQFKRDLLNVEESENSYYSEKVSSFYSAISISNASALDFSEILIKSILDRVIKKEDISLEDIYETIQNRKIIGTIILRPVPSKIVNSIGNDNKKKLSGIEFKNLWKEPEISVNKYAREYYLVLWDSSNHTEDELIGLTIVNSSFTGNLSTSLSVSHRYLEIIEKFNVFGASWAKILKLRESLESFDIVFNVNQTSPMFLHTYKYLLRELGLDELEQEVRTKFTTLDAHVQSKGQLLMNKNLYILTAGLMSLGLIEILISFLNFFPRDQYGFNIFYEVMIVLAILISASIFITLFSQNKR